MSRVPADGSEHRPDFVVVNHLHDFVTGGTPDRGVVMQHQFEYLLAGKRSRLVSSLVVIGKDSHETAMSITVGLPVGIAVRLILEEKILATGVRIPTTPEFYDPILAELEEYGIRFIETGDNL